LATILQSAYQLTDAFWVGRLGGTAVAAVAVTFPVTFLMIAIGAGGLDVAVAMGGGPYHLQTPEVVLVRLKGKLPSWVVSKDIMLELLRRLTVKGSIGKIFEFGGPGVTTLSIPERATIANLGTELGATTTVFPSDERNDISQNVQGGQARITRT
jgi:aconitate hydratase